MVATYLSRLHIENQNTIHKTDSGKTPSVDPQLEHHLLTVKFELPILSESIKYLIYCH